MNYYNEIKNELINNEGGYLINKERATTGVRTMMTYF